MNSYEGYPLHYIRFTRGDLVYIYDPRRKTFDLYRRDNTVFGIPSEEALQQIIERLKVGATVHLFTNGTEDAIDAITLVESLRDNS